MPRLLNPPRMQFQPVPGPAPADAFTSSQAQSLLDEARLLAAGLPMPGLLRGRRLALMRAAGCDEQVAWLCQAAQELGAQVAQIPALLDDASSTGQIEDTARVLGQLYDAVDCEGMDGAVVERLQRSAGIPVYAGLAADNHPSADLAASLPGAAPQSDKRRWMLQALLLQALS